MQQLQMMVTRKCVRASVIQCHAGWANLAAGARHAGRKCSHSGQLLLMTGLRKKGAPPDKVSCTFRGACQCMIWQECTGSMPSR